MEIKKINNTTFQSRNNTIRFADDIARRVNNCYPRISSSKVIYKKAAIKFPEFCEEIILRTNNCMRFFKDKLYDTSNSFYDKIDAFIEPIKNYAIGNCGESAQLAAITAKINGIKNCHIANLCKPDGNDIDHMVLFVNDEKPYIIDAWLGIADYVPNIISKYKNEYFDIIGLKPEDNISFSVLINDEYTDFFKNDFSRKQINKLKKIYPNLFIKRGHV